MGNLSSLPSADGGKLKTIVLLLILFILNPANGFAQATAAPLDIVINEIAWMGTKINGVESKNWWRYEWFELYNNTNQNISLDGWKAELYRTNLDWFLELGGTIPAYGYFLVVSSDKISSNYDQNYSNLGGKFNNSGQKILLKDNHNQVIDEIDCSSGWFAGDNSTKQTMERKDPQISGNNSTNWITSQNPGGTPKTPNNSSAPSDFTEQVKNSTGIESKIYPLGIIINEILPSPEGSDEQNEWIEIFNQNDFDVDLVDWQIGDMIGKTTAYTFPKGTKISPKGFLVLSRPETKITLNNDGDSLNLLQPDGKVIDALTYEKAPLGQSYNRGGTKEGWFWSPILTPGAQNETSIPLSETKVVTEKEDEEPAIKDKFKKEGEPEKGMAAISEQISQGGYNFFFILLITLAAAIFSGVIILFLKRAIRRLDLKIKIE